MVSTRVGYAGGLGPEPTYHDLRGHREAVEVVFDPAVVGYDELLEVFWRGQPTDVPHGPDPRAHLGLLPIGPEQTARARASIADRDGLFSRVWVDLLPDPTFWPAERMHQKFTLQRARPDLVDAGAAAHGGVDSFLASTEAARLNARLTGLADPSGIGLTEAAGSGP